MTTTCRVCESSCGLVARIDGSHVALAPDPAHPVSKGYACRKGTTYGTRVWAHPERLLRPRLRRGDHWQEVSWDEALRSAGERIRAVLDRYGPDSVGLYTGNAVSHSFGAVLGATALQRGLETTRHYSCLTLDNSEMFVVADAVFDNPFATFVADYSGSDFVLLIGTDPLSSQASQSQSHPAAHADLRQRARTGQLAVVDPRRSNTARAATLHLAPTVATDVFLLAWLVREALAAGRWDPVARDSDSTAIAAAVAPFDTDRVSSVTGLSTAALLSLRDRLLAAARPLVWSGLGVLLGPSGTLGWWLTVVLQTVLGGLDRPGGWRLQPGAIDLPRWARRLGLRARDGVRSPYGYEDVLGTLPSAHLARDILDRSNRSGLRALVVLGGDPARSLPDTSQAREALRELDCLVCVDLFENETSRAAHVLLPATTWLERDESGLLSANQRPIPHLRLDRAVLSPRGEARDDFAIALSLCRAAGLVPFGSRITSAFAGRLGPTGLLRSLAALTRIPWGALTSRQGYTGPAATDALRSARTAVSLPLLGVSPWCEALSSLPDPRQAIRLVTSVRSIDRMNHWLSGRSISPSVHPDDGGGLTQITGPAGTLTVYLTRDASLPRRTVVLPYGDPIDNPNQLIGTEQLEPFSGQPWSNGTEVTLLSTVK